MWRYSATLRSTTPTSEIRSTVRQMVSQHRATHGRWMELLVMLAISTPSVQQALTVWLVKHQLQIMQRQRLAAAYPRPSTFSSPVIVEQITNTVFNECCIVSQSSSTDVSIIQCKIKLELRVFLHKSKFSQCKSVCSVSVIRCVIG